MERDRAKAQSLGARLKLARGQSAAAERELSESARTHLRAGRLSAALNDGLVRAYVLSNRLARYRDARLLLRDLQKLFPALPEARAMLPYYRGWIAANTGDLQTALGEFRTSLREARRLALDDSAFHAQESLALVLSLLGRHREATDQLAATLEPSDLSPCERLERVDNRLWLYNSARSLDEAGMQQRVLADRERGDRLNAACESAHTRRDHLLTIALLALQRGDVDGAASQLSALGGLSGGHTLDYDAWEAEVQGQVALRGDALRAAALYFEREVQLAQRAGLWHHLYLGHLGLGRTSQRAGDREAALRSYRQAEAAVDTLVQTIPLGEGRIRFQLDHEQASRALSTLLFDAGQIAAALDVLRQAQLRGLASMPGVNPRYRRSPRGRGSWEEAVARYRQLRARLERTQKDAWQLSAVDLKTVEDDVAGLQLQVRDALTAAYRMSRRQLRPTPLPASAEWATLALFAERPHVMAFCVRGGRVQGQRVPARATFADAPVADTDPWLAPFADCLRGARKVQVLSDGASAEVDVHALRFAGAPLIARMAVVYGLGLGTRSLPEGEGSSPRSRSPDHLLAVYDPTERLPGTALERAAVDGFARRRGRMLRQLSGSAATRARFLEQLPQASRLHFAGHGQSGGLDGEGHGLLLADGLLSATDLILLEQVPAEVVLSACDGARTESDGLLPGIGAAQAFLLAGAQQVVAAPRPIGDELAGLFMQRFYARLDECDSVPEAVREVQRALLAQGAGDDWAAFRVLTP